MEWTTHSLSGIVAGYAITGGDWRGAVVGGIAGVIPDLDEPKSKFGKLFFPIAIPLNAMFGHRTFTHSLLFAVILSAILMYFFDSWVWMSAFVGVIAHIVGDMLTGKVMLLYPFKQSIGISVNRSMFTLIDMVTKVLLIGCVLLLFMDMLSGTTVNLMKRW